MIFAIQTTDQSFGNNKEKQPYKGAVLKKTELERGYILYEWFIEVNTAEELMQMVKDCKYPIILDFDPYNDDRPTIEIYDNYRE